MKIEHVNKRSTAKHTVAALRAIIDMGQKEFAALIGCSTATIQSIEIGRLKLSEDLAVRIAMETGVDSRWLLGGDPNSTPAAGKSFMGHAEKADPTYTKEFFETHRAFMESSSADYSSSSDLALKLHKAHSSAKTVNLNLTVAEMRTIFAASLAERQALEDKEFVKEFAAMLKNARGNEAGMLLRWKVRRFLSEALGEYKQLVANRTKRIKNLKS